MFFDTTLELHINREVATYENKYGIKLSPKLYTLPKVVDLKSFMAMFEDTDFMSFLEEDYNVKHYRRRMQESVLKTVDNEQILDWMTSAEAQGKENYVSCLVKLINLLPESRFLWDKIGNEQLVTRIDEKMDTILTNPAISSEFKTTLLASLSDNKLIKLIEKEQKRQRVENGINYFNLYLNEFLSNLDQIDYKRAERLQERFFPNREKIDTHFKKLRASVANMDDSALVTSIKEASQCQDLQNGDTNTFLNKLDNFLHYLAKVDKNKAIRLQERIFPGRGSAEEAKTVLSYEVFNRENCPNDKQFWKFLAYYVPIEQRLEFIKHFRERLVHDDLLQSSLRMIEVLTFLPVEQLGSFFDLFLGEEQKPKDLNDPQFKMLWDLLVANTNYATVSDDKPLEERRKKNNLLLFSRLVGCVESVRDMQAVFALIRNTTSKYQDNIYLSDPFLKIALDKLKEKNLIKSVKDFEELVLPLKDSPHYRLPFCYLWRDDKMREIVKIMINNLSPELRADIEKSPVYQMINPIKSVEDFDKFAKALAQHPDCGQEWYQNKLFNIFGDVVINTCIPNEVRAAIKERPAFRAVVAAHERIHGLETQQLEQKQDATDENAAGASPKRVL